MEDYAHTGLSELPEDADSRVAEAVDTDNSVPLNLWDLPIFAWAWREDGRDLRA